MSQEWARRFEGRLVAKLSVSSWSETTDEVMLFAHEGGWATLVVSHREDYDRSLCALGPQDVARGLADRLARRDLVRVEWCAVSGPHGVRTATALAAAGHEPPTLTRSIDREGT